MSRDQFRKQTFERDNYKCLFCDCTSNLDAHHIIERRLWTSENELGGYFISNGATLCQIHHLEAEMTTLSCEDIRERAGIEKVIIPEDMYADHQYTKWGDVILLDGRRMPGPLFYRGVYSDKIVKDLFDNLDKNKEEGLVIRLASEFKYKDFKKSVAKLVRKDHIADGGNHWRFKRLTPNLLEIK